MFTVTTETHLPAGRQGGRAQRKAFFVCPENFSGQTKISCLIGMMLAEGWRIYGESVPPPYTSRDLRPILHRNISFRDLRASSESCLEGRAGGENGFTDADYLLLPVISLTDWEEPRRGFRHGEKNQVRS